MISFGLFEGVTPGVPADVVAQAVHFAAAYQDHRNWDGPRFTAMPPGVSFIGRGNTRVVYAIGDYAVKLPWSIIDGDAEFNRLEARTYKRAPAALKRLLLPVLAADPKGLWLIMPRAARASRVQVAEVCRRALRIAVPMGLSDYELDCDEETNAGVWNGQVYLLDYPWVLR